MSDSGKSSAKLYPISLEGKWGFIDASGTVIIQPQFVSVGQFSEGLARVTVQGLTEEDQLFERAASGFIDERGDFVIGPGSPPGYTFPEYRNDYSYGDFHEGRAKFWVGDATGFGGYINRTGKLAIPPKYADVGDFSQGLAGVSLPRADGSTFGPKLAGFIDRNGEFVIAPKREFISLGFSEGLCVIDIQDDDADWHPSVINLEGQTVIPPHIYSGIADFVGGVARIVKDGKVGCIDTEGKIVVPIEFDQLWEFDDSHLTIAKKDGKHFIVDRTGRRVKEITMGEDVDIGRLRSGFAAVRTRNKAGYINDEGRLVISLQFDRGEDFRGDLAKAELDGFKGYINRQGVFVWKTDRWDEPIRNSVTKPLSDFLPPKTVEALPLEYNWQRVRNAIVFASNDPFDSLQAWFTQKFGGRFELIGENDEPGLLNTSFVSDDLCGSFHAVDAKDEEVEGFIGFYASVNMKLLMDRHLPMVLGILILDR